jgi:predicted nucleotidyltransferase
MAQAASTKKDVVERIAHCGGQLHRLGVNTIGLFGSFVRDSATMASDVDMLVSFEPEKKTYDNFIEACFLLEDVLGRKVELVTEESLSPYLKPHIMKEVEYVALAD